MINNNLSLIDSHNLTNCLKCILELQNDIIVSCQGALTEGFLKQSSRVVVALELILKNNVLTKKVSTFLDEYSTCSLISIYTPQGFVATRFRMPPGEIIIETFS